MGRPVKQAVFGNRGGVSIKMSAFIPVANGGSSAADTTDVLKQTGSRSYKVTTAQGTGVVKLVAAVPTVEGTASLVATDSVGGTYFVTKLTAHKALLTQDTGTQFATGTQVQWTLGVAPVLNVSVQLENI